MRMSERSQDAGPGVRWLAARTGKTPEELTASPTAAASALGKALREVSSLAARLESQDPEVRATAQAEVDALREQIVVAPPPAETFGKRVAAGLRERAALLDGKSTKGKAT
ncbi:hypothetical protein NIBR502772_11135 [Pseudarthrobacter sp. NIBRBAC000502772]|uniref:hypothetical protein n=1 Tax=Pseudarthrobacter sp. NIBRBAC000502772 TaxID=2590775 RepID=UPI0011325ECC|nr:hypothetical protein [Pseudarthrobacter sp. NIBRBAC000502772]QDG66685.1 hypothetical protein NIBR502772_11135 [Pseudarthrobacter sp. NIBRBAC000502772]